MTKVNKSMEKKFEFFSTSKDLTQFRDSLKSLLAAAGLGEKKEGEIILAVDEALTNIVRHAYGHDTGLITVMFFDYEDRIEIFIRDSGKLFDPTKMPPPELPPKKPGGLGIYFIQKLMDKVVYQSVPPAVNELQLTKFKS